MNDIKENFVKPGDERALIYFCLSNIDNFYTISSKVNDVDFLYPEHSMIYIILKTLSLKKDIKKFDVSMVIHTAQDSGVLKNIGSFDYIESISKMGLDNANLNIYIENVLEASIKYQLYMNLNHSMIEILNGSKTGICSEDLLGSVESKVMDLSTQAKSISEPKDFTDGLRDYIDEKRDNPVKMSGLSTGYEILDSQIDGLIPGTLMVVCARKKMGKSTFLCNIAAHIAYVKKTASILYVDTEMSFEQWRDRVVSMLSGVEERIVKHGGYTNQQYTDISKCLDIVEKGKLFHHYMPSYSVEKLTVLYKKYKIKENIGLGIFDYIKEPESISIDRQRVEWQLLGDVTTKMKDLSGELNIPFLTAAQLNRSNDLAGSDRIAWYADIIAVWKEKENTELEAKGIEGGQYKLIIRDTRRGGSTPEEGIGYKFKKKKLLIEEVESKFQIISYGEGIIDRADDALV